VILTGDTIIPARTRVTIAPITRMARAIRSEVPLGPAEGLSDESVASLDEIVTVEKRAVDPDPVGALGPVKLRELEAAIHYALTLHDS
jgi:mRNA-degrading endonuclease toxin of MazEF toxin-antitoxin module